MPETETINEKINRQSPDFKNVLSFFEEISKIPRCSQNEERIASYLENFGKENGFETKRDRHNNILIKVPATAGYENAPAVVLQSHMDMVCEKADGSLHNFSSDGIRLSYVTENGIPYLTANGTTLGADNGIGIAYSLAIAASSEIPHPPLELLITTDEEKGLTGAHRMDNDFISANLLLNLDSEEDGVIIVGCAGGTQIGFKKQIEVEDADTDDGEENGGVPVPYTLTVAGLLGGHSGTEIHIGRGNANQILIRFMKTVHEKYPKNCFKIVKMDGGNAHNAIPRHSECLFVTTIPSKTLKAESESYAAGILSDPRFNDAGLTVTVTEAVLSKPERDGLKSFSSENTEQLIHFLSAVQTGVFEMSADIPGLVSVSGNLAKIRTRPEDVSKSKREPEVMYSLRSGSDPKLKNKVNEMITLAKRFCFDFEISNSYTPWEPDFNSELLKTCRDAYRQTFGAEAKVTAIHAGLECGVFRLKYPSMQMVSIGPDIIGAHTPTEKMNLIAAENVWVYLKEILKSL
ncbi:MAG: beta-Ala-His dipeptidase [Methanimicrococcus sp.]|nr:beta-Ala-His dipeptidase [Methanimicrococcus sp.]